MKSIGTPPFLPKRLQSRGTSDAGQSAGN